MKYRKKPVVIEAQEWHPEYLSHPMVILDPDKKLWGIKTLEGFMICTPGDFVIKGVKGEFYPCKPDIFAATYEAVPEDTRPR